MKLVTLAVCSLFLSISACTQGKAMFSGQNSGVWQDADGNRYETNLNPSPKKPYELTVTLIDAPENLIVTEVKGYYKADCEISTNKAAGAFTELSRLLPVEFKKTGKNTYASTLYYDAILDEDYHHKGQICHWRLQSGIVILAAEPNIEKASYTAIVTIQKSEEIATGHWRYDGYITRYRFNEPRENKEWHTFGVLESKDLFGPVQRQELATVRLDLRRK